MKGSENETVTRYIRNNNERKQKCSLNRKKEQMTLNRDKKIFVL